MFAAPMTLLAAVSLSQLLAQSPAAFEVASVKMSQKSVGPDENNQVRMLPDGISGRNVTLQRLAAEAWELQISQVSGPAWIRQNEYDVEVRAGVAITRAQMETMLQSLLRERFDLHQHDDLREARVYELAVESAGARLHPVETATVPPEGTGLHFHGEMRDLADLLAVQLTIPAAVDPSKPVTASEAPAVVVDRTGLVGAYDFPINTAAEPGAGGFTIWQRALHELGLRITRSREKVRFVVIDSARRVPEAN